MTIATQLDQPPTVCPVCTGDMAPRLGKSYCKAACRRKAWGVRQNLVAALAKDSDFNELRDAVQRIAAGRMKDFPVLPRIVGYVVRYDSPVGRITFPEPGRRTKRRTDKSARWHVSADPYFRLEPFEQARVPAAAKCEIFLVDEEGGVIRTLKYVTLTRFFPSVRLYDDKFHYDSKGRVLWANGAARKKPRRRRPRRRTEDVTTTLTEREHAVTNTPPAPPATAKTTAATVPPAPKPEVRPAAKEPQDTEMARRLAQALQDCSRHQQEASRHQQEASRLQRELDLAHLQIRAQSEEMSAMRGRNISLARRAHPLTNLHPSEPTTTAPVEPVGVRSQPVVSIPSPPAGNSDVENRPASPVEAARHQEQSMPLANAAPIDNSDQPTPSEPLDLARQDEPPLLTSAEPTPSPIAETRAPPAPATDPPKPDGKSKESKNRKKQSAGAPPKRPPNGPLFGLAADNWRTSHRIR